MMNLNEVQNLKVGDKLEHTLDTAHGKPLPGARWHEPQTVVEITYRGKNVYTGKEYVGGYLYFSENARISFSIMEGDGAYRIPVYAAPTEERK